MTDTHDHDENPLQGYFEWQSTTIMLAMDLAEPLPEGDQSALIKRHEEAERLVQKFTLALVPDELQKNPNLDWPPDLMRAITAETVRQAARIIVDAEEAAG